MDYDHDLLMDDDYDHDLLMDDDKGSKIAATTAGVGTLAGIGAVFSGSSASAMTGTLATIGMGSMAAGIGVVAAAPLAAAGIAYGVSRLFSDD